MSSPFNYELDERTVRVKLKDLEVPYKEEAWMHFDTFCENCKKTVKAPIFPALSLNLSRNIILPIIFGSVILLFTVLLFNFVDIKKSPRSEQAIPQKPAKELTPAPVPIPIADTVEKKSTLPQQTGNISQTEIPTSTVASPAEAPKISKPTSSANLFVTIASGPVFQYADVTTKVIGQLAADKTLEPLEETNFFVKIAFGTNGETGYFRKQLLRRPNGENVKTPAADVKKEKAPVHIPEVLRAPAAIPVGPLPEVK
jgi:hypothetical protein